MALTDIEKRVARDVTLQESIIMQGGNPSIALDGTVDTYKKVMRRWFLANGAEEYALAGDYASLTELCDKWYAYTRDDWCGYTVFYQPDVSAVTTGTKGGDNTDLECTPSTDTVANTDDYAGLPLFACVDVNFVVLSSDDETHPLRPQITAIDGITSNFKRTDPATFVGVMQMSGWHFWLEDDETYTVGYAANRNINYRNMEPLPEAVNPDDNSVREWVIHAKYMSYTNDSQLTSCAGHIPTAFLSHNTVHTRSKVDGSQYSGTCACDDAFLKLMVYIKYASLTLDGILQGCVNNNHQCYAQVAETGVKRILLSETDGAYFEVGESVIVGYYSEGIDRGSANTYAYTGNTGALISKIETVTVDDVDYIAVYVDVDETFDTAANGSATDGSTVISTWHWITGTTDGVLGNDGSPTDCTSGKYPAKIQGIEIMNGCYEIIADCILSLYVDDDGVYWYEPYIVSATADQNTALTDDYVATGAAVEQQDNTSTSWYYIEQLYMENGVWFPKKVGGSSSTYTRDGMYFSAAESTGTREWLARGDLGSGVAPGGLSCVHGHHSLSGAGWNYGARLSPNGNRGEFVA